MKKIVFILLLLAFAVTAFGQKDKFEKIREAKKEFIKKKLALTEDEEKKFMPLLEKYMDESDELRKQFKSKVDLEEVDLTFMSDEECEKLINEIVEFKQKEVDLIKRYTAEFKKVLPVKKVAMLFKAETEFRHKLLKDLKKGMRKGEKGSKGDKGDKGEKGEKGAKDFTPDDDE